ncbi:MAG: tRNA pseudouridine(38-40) synthase TruA [Thermoflexibacteraceae bacterium]|jgi:tRNA pseudouridine38-40 synthase
MRFKLYLEYDGTQYSGWQINPSQKTVQGELLKAAQTVFRAENIEVYGAGRTDAGVHAMNQVAHLDVKTTLIPDHIRQKLNDELPADINILKVEATTPTFHARHDAKARSYTYHIAKRRTAFGKRYAWWVKEKLDVKAMQTAAQLLVGFHDFQSFSDNTPEEKSTMVEIKLLQIVEKGSLLTIHIVGSHFLWKMVRRIVGVLVEIGKGKMTVDTLKGYLKNNSHEPAQYTAPAHALFLEKIYYENEKITPNYQTFFGI